jgi:predicted nucleic acid-binding protein
MQLRVPERIYIDSNIWFAYLTNGQYELESNKANDIFDRIISKQNQIAVISRLVIIEVINVIRNRIVQRTKYTGMLEVEQYGEIREIVDDNIIRFIDIITRWSKSKKLEIYYTKSPIES